jgi:hypothetical protein
MFSTASSGPLFSCATVAAFALGVSGPVDDRQAGSVLIHAFGVLLDPLPLINLPFALRASCASYTHNLGWGAFVVKVIIPLRLHPISSRTVPLLSEAASARRVLRSAGALGEEPFGSHPLCQPLRQPWRPFFSGSLAPEK